jgi:hypothetical protein
MTLIFGVVVLVFIAVVLAILAVIISGVMQIITNIRKYIQNTTRKKITIHISIAVGGLMIAWFIGRIAMRLIS